MKAQLNKTSHRVINLVKEIGDINKYKIEHENYFLHHDNNIIDATFFSELNKKNQMYGIILYFSDNKKILPN